MEENGNIILFAPLEGPPDLVAEILSPSTRRRDRIDKMKSMKEIMDPIPDLD